MAGIHYSYVRHVDPEDESQGMVARCDCGWEGRSGVKADTAIGHAEDHRVNPPATEER